MPNLAGAAKLHRTQFQRYLLAAGRDVLVRQPATGTAGNAVDRTRGKRSEATGVGTTATVKAIVSSLYAFSSTEESLPPAIRAVGKTDKIDLVLRFALADVLLDADNGFGRTSIEAAKDIVLNGEPYTVVVTERGGLPPLDPYILWAAVRKEQ